MSRSNPFEQLGLPVLFDLDTAALQKRLVSLASIHHPDRFMDPLQQADAAAKLAAINHAYHLLREPLSRAQAMLDLLAPLPDTADKPLPPDLLMEMMEAREELEQAQASHDHATLDKLKHGANEKYQNYYDTLTQSLRRITPQTDPQAPSAQAALQQARLQLHALRYIQRMLDEM